LAFAEKRVANGNENLSGLGAGAGFCRATARIILIEEREAAALALPFPFFGLSACTKAISGSSEISACAMSAIFDLLPVLPQQQTWMASSPTSEFDPQRTQGLDGLLPQPTIQSRPAVALQWPSDLPRRRFQVTLKPLGGSIWEIPVKSILWNAWDDALHVRESRPRDCVNASLFGMRNA